MKVVFGDNHFFGVNHLSIEKAEQYKDTYSSKDKVRQCFKSLVKHGVKEQMISAHPTASDVVKVALETHPDLIIHPVIPYAHSINDKAASKGVLNTAIGMLRPSVTDIFRLSYQFLAPNEEVLTPRSSIKRFVEAQLETFSDIPIANRGTLFINNVFCDMLMGMGMFEWFEAFPGICRELGYKAGIITYNPELFTKNVFPDLSMCINYNCRNYLYSLSKDELEKLRSLYDVWVMGVFGSGAYEEDEVIKDLKEKRFDRVLFSSSKEERLDRFVSAMS